MGSYTFTDTCYNFFYSTKGQNSSGICLEKYFYFNLHIHSIHSSSIFLRQTMDGHRVIEEEMDDKNRCTSWKSVSPGWTFHCLRFIFSNFLVFPPLTSFYILHLSIHCTLSLSHKQHTRLLSHAISHSPSLLSSLLDCSQLACSASHSPALLSPSL